MSRPAEGSVGEGGGGGGGGLRVAADGRVPAIAGGAGVAGTGVWGMWDSNGIHSEIQNRFRLLELIQKAQSSKNFVSIPRAPPSRCTPFPLHPLPAAPHSRRA